MLEKLEIQKIHALLALVSDEEVRLDIDIVSTLLDSVINGDPDMKESAISALLTLIESHGN